MSPGSFRSTAPRAVLIAALLAALFGALMPATQPAQAISGGKPSASPYPFLGALLHPASPRDDLVGCATTLIAPEWAVTARHCMRGYEFDASGHPVGWKVRFGSLDTRSGGELIEVDSFVKTKAGMPLIGDDVALLKLARPATATPLQLVTAEPKVGTPTRIAGWGWNCDPSETDPKGCYPEKLHEADTQVQDRALCEIEKDARDEICVGSADGKVAPGNTDSGGPALIKDAAAPGGWRIAGVVSSGNSNQPSAYANLDAFRGWINDYVTGKKKIPADKPAPPAKDVGQIAIESCMGSIVRGERQGLDDPATLMTNGHCLREFPPAGKIVGGTDDRRIVNIVGKSGKYEDRAYTKRLEYGTMSGTDVALYTMTETFRQLQKRGVEVLEFGTAAPKKGDKVTVHSLVTQGGNCVVDAIVPKLREENYTTTNMIRFKSTDDCAPVQGISGSAVVDPKTNKIVAIYSTGVEDTDKACSANNPCEVGADGKTTMMKGMRYAAQAVTVGKCLDKGSKVNLAAKGCELPRGTRLAGKQVTPAQ